MPGQSAQGARRSVWWPAVWAAVIAFTVVVSSGAVLLVTRLVDERSEPAPSPVRHRSAEAAATTPVTPPATKPVSPETTRLELLGPRRVLDRPLPAGTEDAVPLPGVPRGAAGVLLDVSVLDATAAGALTLVSGSEETPVLRLPGAGARTSTTVVLRLGPDGRLRARSQSGGRVVVTLTGAFLPAAAATAGRIVPVPPRPALRLVPRRDGNEAVLDPGRLSLTGTPGDGVAALLLTVTADVGARGGSVALGPSAGNLVQQVHWAATSAGDRTRRGFLVVPLTGEPVHLSYHAGTELRVDVVGIVTGPGAEEDTAGLVVPVPARGLPPVTVPAGGRAAVRLPGADNASAALVTTATARPGGPPRSVLGLFAVRDGAVQVSGPQGAQVTLTPRALVTT